MQRDDLIRALPEQQAVFREQHPAAGAQEQLSSERILQLRQLPGKRRLRQVQAVRGDRHVLVFRDREEVAECAEFHIL